jgi:hypothetical protein
MKKIVSIPLAVQAIIEPEKTSGTKINALNDFWLIFSLTKR